VFWAVAGRTQAAEGKLATSFFAAEIGLDPISAFAKNSGALVLIMLLTSCNSYEEFVKDELRIPYVFMPPNTAWGPLTALQYRDNENFQRACLSTEVSGLSEGAIATALDKRCKSTATFGIATDKQRTFDVEVSKKEIGNADAKYEKINKVKLNLTNGAICSLPVDLDSVLINISRGKCRKSLKAFIDVLPDSQLYIPLEVFRYDVTYSLFTEEGTDVTLDISDALKMRNSR